MKHTITGYVTYEKARHMDKPRIDFQTWKPGKHSIPAMVVVCEHSIEVEVPDDFDPRPDLIKGLEEQQQKARADFEKLCTDIQRQISELTCLEAQ